MSIINHRVRTSKPDHPVDIDWNSPLSDGLELFWYALGDGTYVTLSRADPVIAGSVDIAMTNTDGEAAIFTGSGNIRIPITPNLDQSNDFGYACGYVYDGGTPSSWARLWGRTANDGASPYFNWDVELWPGGVADTFKFGIYDGGFNELQVTYPVALPVGEHVILGRVHGSIFYGSINDFELSKAATSPSPYLTGNNDVYLGGSGLAKYANISGGVQWGAFWSRAPSDEIAYQIRHNIWQILEPDGLEICKYKFLVSTPVLNTFSMTYEALSDINTSTIMGLESLKSIIQSFIPLIESLSLVSDDVQVNHEFIQRLSSQLTGSYESLVNISQKSAENYESLFPVKAESNLSIELNQEIFVQSGVNYESLGFASITASHLIAFETAGYLQAIDVIGLESKKSITKTEALFHESLMSVSEEIKIELESISFIQMYATGKIEVIGNITSADSLNIEGLMGIAGSAVLTDESLIAIANAVQIPFEDFHGISVNVILNVVDKTAYFSIQVDNEVMFTTILDKTVTFH